MIESGSADKDKELLSMAHEEEEMVKAVANEDRALLRVKEGDLQVSEQFLGSGKVYRVDKTGALATVNSAVALLNQYCNHLPRDKFSSTKPIFLFKGREGRFSCEIELPINSAVRKVYSGVFTSQLHAKQDACLEGCKLLHQCHALTDHLFPAKSKGLREDEMDPSPSGAYPIGGRAFFSYTGCRCIYRVQLLTGELAQVSWGVTVAGSIRTRAPALECSAWRRQCCRQRRFATRRWWCWCCTRPTFKATNTTMGALSASLRTKVSERFPLIAFKTVYLPLNYGVDPEVQWRILQGCKRETLGVKLFRACRPSTCMTNSRRRRSSPG